ncbi:MAG TPA: hypothetical protein VL981_12130 [Candidatus Methylacidiphilales bacterium]|nr:hypothetical protein [Candidatus Methylacidiphilales bacterium]
MRPTSVEAIISITGPVYNFKALAVLFGFWTVLAILRAEAADWTTTDGKVYQEVMVVKVEDDAVTILYKDGGALIPLVKLPSELQKKFHYDPEKAKIAAEARAKRDAQNAAALQAEKDETQKIEQQKLADEAKAQQQQQAGQAGH